MQLNLIRSDFSDEVWKDIPNYGGVYMVSNFGRVRRVLGKNRIMSPNTESKGYKSVALHYLGKRKIYKVHRLVLFAFDSDKSKTHQTTISQIKIGKSWR